MQIGDVLLADGTDDASGYSLTGHPSFPEPAPAPKAPPVREPRPRLRPGLRRVRHYEQYLYDREIDAMRA